MRILLSEASWAGAGPELGNKVWMKNFPNFLGVKICFRGCENRAKFIVYAIGSIWADLDRFWILFQGCTGYMESCTGYMGKVAQAIWRVAQAIWASCTGYMEVFLIIMLSQASWAVAGPELGNKIKILLPKCLQISFWWPCVTKVWPHCSWNCTSKSFRLDNISMEFCTISDRLCFSVSVVWNFLCKPLTIYIKFYMLLSRVVHTSVCSFHRNLPPLLWPVLKKPAGRVVTSLPKVPWIPDGIQRPLIGHQLLIQICAVNLLKENKLALF